MRTRLSTGIATATLLHGSLAIALMWPTEPVQPTSPPPSPVSLALIQGMAESKTPTEVKETPIKRPEKTARPTVTRTAKKSDSKKTPEKAKPEAEQQKSKPSVESVEQVTPAGAATTAKSSNPSNPGHREMPATVETAAPSAAERNYLTALMRAIEAHKHYPRRAKRMGIEGRTALSFTLHPDGSISDIRIEKSSGDKLLDNAASDAIRAVERFTPPPTLVLRKAQRLTMTMAFNLR